MKEKFGFTAQDNIVYLEQEENQVATYPAVDYYDFATPATDNSNIQDKELVLINLAKQVNFDENDVELLIKFFKKFKLIRLKKTLW